MLQTIFRVPNTEEGKDFLLKATKYLNKDDYRIVKRGRNPNRAEVAKVLGKRRGAFHQEIPLKYSTYFAVYIHQKNRGKYE